MDRSLAGDSQWNYVRMNENNNRTFIIKIQFIFSFNRWLALSIANNVSSFSYFINSTEANMEGPEVTFLFQFGNLRDMVTVPASTINLKSLKDLACDFINSKVSVATISIKVKKWNLI